MEFFSEYLRQDHLLSRVDARIKLFTALFVILLTISYQGILFPVFILSLAIMVSLNMKIPLKVLAIRFSEPLFIVIVLVLIKTFSQGKSPFFSIDAYLFTLTLYSDGLYEGILLSLRILAAVSVVVILGFAMPFTEFMAALSWFRAPRVFVEILVFAYRYIFVLLEEALVIYNAQKNRLGYSNLRRGLSSFGVLSGSLTLKAFEHSQNTATAMIQRGFDGDMPMLKHRALRLGEVAGAMFFLAIITALWKL